MTTLHVVKTPDQQAMIGQLLKIRRITAIFMESMTMPTHCDPAEIEKAKAILMEGFERAYVAIGGGVDDSA